MIGFIPLTIYGLVMWIVRSKRYNDGRITIKVYQPPLLKVEPSPSEEGETQPEVFENKGEEEYAEHAGKRA